MKNKLVMLLLGFSLVWVVACGGTTAAPAANNPPANSAPDQPPATEVAEIAASEVEPAGATPGTVTVACEDYLRFCVTSEISGAVNATATAGMGGNIGTCADWAAAGDPRVVEMPMMQGAGDDRITVALTRIAAYTGPGRYELQNTVTEGIPDMFPTIEAGGRAFSYGDGATAVVTMAADGSGTVEATGLVEIPSLTVSEPDPTARVDFAMQWTCRDIE